MDTLNTTEGILNKELGMAAAEHNANKQHEEWSEIAYSFLVEYAKRNKKFMAEEARILATKLEAVPVPPSKRAWGSVIVRAKQSGILKHVGYGQVRNQRAHRANASIWQSEIYQSGMQISLF